MRSNTNSKNRTWSLTFESNWSIQCQPILLAKVDHPPKKSKTNCWGKNCTELVTHLICMEIITFLPHNKMFAEITPTNFKKYSVGTCGFDIQVSLRMGQSKPGFWQTRRFLEEQTTWQWLLRECKDWTQAVTIQPEHKESQISSSSLMMAYKNLNFHLTKEIAKKEKVLASSEEQKTQILSISGARIQLSVQ